MGPEEFIALMERVFKFIPDNKAISIPKLVKKASKGDTSGYGTSNAKAAILALKADGRIEIDNENNIWRQ